jgi:hypothetical protein
MSIAKAFVAAKKDFAPALKTSSNPHFRSKYADLAGCLEAVNDALLANGIAVFQETSLCEDGVIVETVFLHESGETLRGGKLHVPASKQDPQGYGSALTYARRYSIMAACGIAAEDDDGNAASRPRPQQARNPLDNVAPPATPPAPAPAAPRTPGWKLKAPGKAEPLSVHESSDEWVTAYLGMLEKIESSKMATRAKMTKCRELKEANQDTIDSLHAGQKAKALADYTLRIKRLGAANTEVERNNATAEQ